MFIDLLMHLDYSNAAYNNLLKEDFIIWHDACRQIAPGSLSRSALDADFNRKLQMLDYLTRLISSANSVGGTNVEDLLSEKLSSEAVSRLVT